MEMVGKTVTYRGKRWEVRAVDWEQEIPIVWLKREGELSWTTCALVEVELVF